MKYKILNIVLGEVTKTGTVSGVAMNTSALIFGLGFKATTGTPTIRVVSVEGQGYNMD